MLQRVAACRLSFQAHLLNEKQHQKWKGLTHTEEWSSRCDADKFILCKFYWINFHPSRTTSSIPFCFSANSYQMGTSIKSLLIQSPGGSRKRPLRTVVSTEFVKQNVENLSFLEEILTLLNCKLLMLIVHFSLPARFTCSFPLSADSPVKANCPPFYQQLSFSFGKQCPWTFVHESKNFSRNVKRKSLILNLCLNAVCLFFKNPYHFASTYIPSFF